MHNFGSYPTNIGYILMLFSSNLCVCFVGFASRASKHCLMNIFYCNEDRTNVGSQERTLLTENTFSVLLFLGVECWLFEKGMYSSYSSQKYIVWILIIRTILWFFIKQIHLPSICRNTNRHLVWKKAFLHLYTSTKIYILKPGNGCIPAIYC